MTEIIQLFGHYLTLIQTQSVDRLYLHKIRLMTFTISNVCGKIQFWSLYFKEPNQKWTVTILPNYIYFKKLGFFKEYLQKLFQMYCKVLKLLQS